MENEKVRYLIDMIDDMDIKNKLRLAICMSKSEWSGLIYNTKENYEKFDNMLKDIDEEYRTTLINFGKYKLVMFAMAKLMEMETTDQNKVALYLFNNINLFILIIYFINFVRIFPFRIINNKWLFYFQKLFCIFYSFY